MKVGSQPHSRWDEGRWGATETTQAAIVVKLRPWRACSNGLGWTGHYKRNNGHPIRASEYGRAQPCRRVEPGRCML
jgi:hypothetical protein